MLHAMTAETKNKAQSSRTPAEPSNGPNWGASFGFGAPPVSFGPTWDASLGLGAPPVLIGPNNLAGQTPTQRRGERMRTLQRTIGNQAVLRMLANERAREAVLQRKCACGGLAGSTQECAECQQKKGNISSQQSGESPSPITHEGIQAKLTMGQVGDQYEQEADRVADEVMRMSAQSTVVQAIHPVSGSNGSNCRRASYAPGNIDSGDLPSIVARGTSSGGQALDPETRSFMEARFGLDFGHVRMHTDSDAARSARAINALAYTVANDIVFAQGMYAPRNDSGRRLIAHELVHTVQQGGVIASRRNTRQADTPLQRSRHWNSGWPPISIQRLADGGGVASDLGVYDYAGQDEARAALIEAIGEEKLRLLEGFAYAGQTQEGEIAAMRTLDPGFSTITQRIGRPAVMAAGTAAIIGGVAAAVIICAAAWFFYTLSKYPTKSDKWMHCYASCKIASYCGVIPGVGSVISALIGGGKEIADWIGDQFGLHMQAEWEDFMADIEGAFLCGGWGIFSGSCYDCCDKKRGKK